MKTLPFADSQREQGMNIKLIAFELAAKFSRRRENPVQPRSCNAKNAIFKRLKTGVSLQSRSSPANSNAISFTLVCINRNKARIYSCMCVSTHMFSKRIYVSIYVCMYVRTYNENADLTGSGLLHLVSHDST